MHKAWDVLYDIPTDEPSVVKLTKTPLTDAQVAAYEAWRLAMDAINPGPALLPVKTDPILPADWDHTWTAFPPPEPRRDGIPMYDVCFRGVPRLPDRDPNAVLTEAPMGAWACKAKVGARLWGIATRPRLPMVCRSCVHNEELGLVNRMFQLHRNDEEAWDIVWRAVLRAVRDGGMRFLRVLEMPIHSWLHRERVTAIREAELLGAYEWESEAWRSGDFTSKVFIKREILLKACPVAIPDAAPRIIQGRQDAERVTVGPWLYSLSEALKRILHRENWLCYDSGHNAEALGHWFGYHRDRLTANGHDVVSFENDCPRWDGSVDICALAFDRRLHKAFCIPKKVKRALDRAFSAKGWTRHGLFFKQEGTQQSGHDKTTVANTPKNIFMHLAVAYDAFDALGYKGHIGDYIALMGRGDDQIMLCERRLAEEIARRVPAFLARCGFGSKVTLNFDPVLSEYCSGRFWPTASGRYVWAPKIGRALGKMGWRLESGPEPPGYRVGVSLGNWNDYAHVPVLRAMAAWQIRRSGARPGIDHPAHDPGSWRSHALLPHRPAAAAFEMAAALYDCTVHDLLSLEAAILQAPLCAGMMDNWLIARILDKDVSLPAHIHGQRVEILYDGCAHDADDVREFFDA